MIRPWRRQPLAVRVPAVVAAPMVLAGFVASQQVPAELTRGQGARLRELVRLHVDGLSVALGPSVRRQDIWEICDRLDRAGRAVRALVAFNGTFTLALACVGYVAVRRMMRPVSILARHMGSAGADPVPIPAAQVPAGDPEMARLFRTYNGMTDAIRARAVAERRLSERERLVSLGRLSSALAHAIKNPLGGLLNAADTIRCSPDRPDVVRQSVDLLLRGLNHMRDVARAILEHNRLDRTGAALTREDFDDLRLLISPELERLGQRLTWQIDAGAGDLAPHPAGPVRQLLLNLLLNASSASAEGGWVGLSVVADDGGLAMTIRDEGPGLGAAAVARLLRGDVTAPGGGVGLGVVHDLVRARGGHIHHAGAEDRTEIRVRLPQGHGRGAA